MSLVSKSKSKDKKAGKEQRTTLKSTVVVNGGDGLPASAYNPLLGTFHTIDTPSASSAAQVFHGNGRFRNIDDSEDHSTHVSGGDCDSASNNDTRSVESEDQIKERSNVPDKQEVIPGVDNDKREKMRHKNEKKHQRQKEKRAQELHERCSGYLMSRKLEALAQQLVSMGFSQERATMALILNEGRVEVAVAWLFEVGEDSDGHKDRNLGTGNNLKIDISEELARIDEMEAKYKCSKQEVERAVVTCEGDLEKSEDILRSQKHEQPEISPKSEEASRPPVFSNGKISVAASQSNVRLLQPKPNSLSLPQNRDDKNFNYAKPAVTLGLAPKLVPKSAQPATKVLPKLDWARPPQIMTSSEKRWPVGGSSSPSVSYSLAPPLQPSSLPSKVESRHISFGDEYKNFQPGSVREPVIMMQRPQSVNSKPAPIDTSISSSLSGGAISWYPPNSEAMKPNGFSPHIPSTRSPSPNNLTTNQYYPPQYHQPQQHHQQHHQQQHPMFPVSNPMDNFGSSQVNGSFSRVGPPTTLAAASSLGLFSGIGSSTCSSVSISPVDWNTSTTMPSCDYTSIDWSLDKSFLPSKPNGLSEGLGGPYSWSNSVIMPTRPPSSNGNGVPTTGLQDGGRATSDPSSASSYEWTSPFEGKDLFSLPRHFVFSPSQ